MENYRLVRPEHLNHHGYLFGGVLLMWLDEFAWMAATLDYPGSKFVTVGMENIIFKKRVNNGSILKFYIEHKSAGKTSVTYYSSVYKQNDTEVFSTNVTFVNINEKGNPTPIIYTYLPK